MNIKKLKEELAEIIALIPVLSDETELEENRSKALEIINKLKEHFRTIDFYMEVGKNYITILDYIRFFDVKPNQQENESIIYNRLNNATLLKLEQAIEADGGRTTKEVLERREIIFQENREAEQRSSENAQRQTRVGASNTTPAQENRPVQEIDDEYNRVNRRIEELNERPLAFKVIRDRSASI